MTLLAWIGSVSTVISVLAFAGVVWYAGSRSRKARFDAAAQAPFAIPDEVPPADARATTVERRR